MDSFLFSIVENTTKCVVDNTAGCDLDVQKSMNNTLENILGLIDGRCEQSIEVSLMQ